MNRRQLLSLLGVSPAILAASPAEAREKKHKNVAGNGGDDAKFTGAFAEGHSPAGTAFFHGAAAEHDSRERQSISSTPDSWARISCCSRWRLWFQKNQPDVKTVFRKKAGTVPRRRSKALGGDQGQRQRDHHGHRPLKRLHPSDRRSLRNDGKDGHPERADRDARLRRFGEVSRQRSAACRTLRIVFTVHPCGARRLKNCAAAVNGPDPITRKADDEGNPRRSDHAAFAPKIRNPGCCRFRRGPRLSAPTRLTICRVFHEQRDDGLHADHHSHGSQSSRDAQGHEPPARRSWSESRGRVSAVEYTVRQVAVNAVMAGCDPEYLPDRARDCVVGRPSLGTSTTSFGYSMIINGPIRDKLNMNYGIGALGPFAQSNATIGRAWTMMGKNLGNGGIPGRHLSGAARATTSITTTR